MASSRIYTANGICANSAPPRTAVSVTGTSAVRPGLFDVSWGMVTAPNATDFHIAVAISRYTADGTGTSFTGLPLDPAGVAATGVVKTAHSGEPTYTANQNMYYESINQRAPWRWVCQDGFEIWGPATANNGLGSQLAVSANTIQVASTVMWKE
jgi:hypothetical protein